jgi:hypothetical protein
MSPREAATRLVDSWDRDPQGPWPELEALREALAEEERKKKWAMAAAQAEEEAGGFPPVGLAALAEAEKAEAEPTVQRESVTDALSIVESYGPWGADLNDAHRRQIVLAEEVLRLRHVYELAVRGRAEMRDALRREREAEKADVPHHCTPEQIDELIGVLDDHANPEPGRRYDDTDWRSLANVCALVIRHLRSHTHPAAALPELAAWTPVTTRLPPWEERKVVCYTEGYDYGGAQFITMPASDFYCYDEDDPDEPGSRESKTVSHWIYEDDLIAAARGKP